MRLHRAFGALLATLAVTLAARSAAAQTDPASSTDGNGSAPTPQKNQNTIIVSFADSAAGLPQEDIRVAIAHALEQRPLNAKLTAGELRVAVEHEHLIVSFRSAQGYTERFLPIPKERDEIPLLVGLLAVNLARDQSADVRTDANASTTPPRKPPPAAPTYARHYLGLHVAQDFLSTGGPNPCALNSDVIYTPFACYEQGTEVAYNGNPNPSTASLSHRPTLATTRLLLSYDYAFSPQFTLGTRVGVAIHGSPPTAQPMMGNGQASFPWQLEARASYWVVPLTNEPWHVHVGVGAGLAQVSTKRTHTIEDCGNDSNNGGPLDDATFQACTTGSAQGVGHSQTLDVWSKTGQAFVAAHAGVTYSLTKSLTLDLNMNVQYMFPVNALALSPSLGVVVGL